MTAGTRPERRKGTKPDPKGGGCTARRPRLRGAAPQSRAAKAALRASPRPSGLCKSFIGGKTGRAHSRGVISFTEEKIRWG